MPFSVPIELHEKCMPSIFPYMETVWLSFLVNSGELGLEERKERLKNE